MSKKDKRSSQPLVGVVSLGCPKNLVDTETMLGRFVEAGYAITPDPHRADVVVVNTCGFLAAAEAESRDAIIEMAGIKAGHPGQRLVVTGCLAQRHGEKLLAEIPGIDLLLGSGHHTEVVPLLGQLSARGPVIPISHVTAPVFPTGEEPRVLATPGHTAYLKIAEGCDNPCSFCIIPQLRGPYRSRPVAELVREAVRLAEQGVRELVVISQDTTFYGRDMVDGPDLADLLTALQEVPGIDWIRLMYLYPALITSRLLETMARLDKVVPYLDVPLQHSHPEVLRRMVRPGQVMAVERLMERVREHLPGAVVRTAFIVGFPGETEEEFEHLMSFVRNSRFDHVGVFPYSDEADAASYRLAGKVSGEVARGRMDRLLAMQQGISRERLAEQMGRTISVLIEGSTEDGLLVGRSRGQAPEVDGVVYVIKGKKDKVRAGDIVRVVVTQSYDYDLVGKKV